MSVFDRVLDREDIDTRRLSLGEHLEELRGHVKKALLWFVLALGACLYFQEPLMKWATGPHEATVKNLRETMMYRVAIARLDGTTVANVQQTLEGLAALEKDARNLERNAVLVKLKLDAEREKRFAAYAERRAALAGRIAALRAEQDTLLSSADAARAADVEKRRLALAKEVEEFAAEVRREVEPVAERDGTIPVDRLVQDKYTSGVMAYLKLAVIFAIFFASPLIAREFWRFISAGLYAREKKYVRVFAPFTLLIFVAGCSFGYYVLIPAGLKFLASYADPESVMTLFNLSDYLSLVLTLTIAIGLIFELPIIMSFVALVGFFTPDQFAKFRRYWVLVAFVLAAVVSPTPDPFNQVLCAVPIIVLYEIGIWSSRWLVARRKAAEAADKALDFSMGNTTGTSS